MAYSEIVPKLFESLEASRKEQTPSHWASTAGARILESPIPQFRSPWAQMASAFGRSLIGGVLQEHGADSQRAAQQEYDARVSQAVLEASALPTVEEQMNLLQQKGFGKIAQMFGLTKMGEDADNANTLKDPKYILDKYKVEEDVKIRRDQLALDRLKHNLEKTKMEIESGKATGKAIEDYKDRSLEIEKLQQGILRDFNQNKEVQVYQDFARKEQVMSGLLEQIETLEAKGDKKGANSAYQKLLDEFVKKPGEAQQKDDLGQYLGQLGYWEKLDLYKSRASGGGGSYVNTPEQAKNLAKTVSTIREGIAERLRTRYLPLVKRVDSTLKILGPVPESLTLLEVSQPTNALRVGNMDLFDGDYVPTRNRRGEVTKKWAPQSVIEILEAKKKEAAKPLVGALLGGGQNG
jgi:hypothetical protein